MMQRQHSVDPTPGHVEMQAPPQKLVTSTGQVIYRQHHPQAMQKQQLPPQSPSVGQVRNKESISIFLSTAHLIQMLRFFKFLF